MEITLKQYATIEHCLSKQLADVSLSEVTYLGQLLVATNSAVCVASVSRLQVARVPSVPPKLSLVALRIDPISYRTR